VFPASDVTTEIVVNRNDYSELTNMIVEVIELKKGLSPKKVSSFWWGSP
jgi:hypothetical protein